MTDVIDVDDNFSVRRALTFKGGERKFLEADKLVGVHFENPKGK